MRLIKGRRRWLVATAATGLLVAQLLSWAPAATGINEKPGEPVDLRGFATGQPAHVDALNFDETRVVDTEVAWSAASVDADADGLAGVKQNEFTRTIHPDLGDKLSHARGSGLELGLGTTPVDENQLVLTGLAQADAPPSSHNREEISTEDALSPLAYASLLRGDATANAQEGGLVPDVCVLGDDISRGIGYAADVALVDTGDGGDENGLEAPLVALDDQDVANDPQSVSQSTSRTKLVPAGGNQFGLMSEVRQTIAPIQLAQVPTEEGDAALTIRVLGEWVLRAVATGSPGGASIFYGPGEVSPQTNVLEILGLGDDPILLTLQDLLGEEGLNIPAAPLLDITLGEGPRAIAAPGANPEFGSDPAIAANGRSASAAVDVLRIRIGDGVTIPVIADLRVGHMETSVEVPNGGVTCPIPVTKTADPTSINVKPSQPDTSHIELTVHNVFDCDLTNVVLTDTITAKEDSHPDYTLSNGDPAPKSPSFPHTAEDGAETVLTWELGTIKKGTTAVVSFDLSTIEGGAGGLLEDIARAAGTFANCVGEDASGLAINGLDLTGFSIPVQVRIELPRTGADAARTVAMGGGLALAASSLGLFLRRRSRRAAA